MYCPQCRAEYRQGFTHCDACDVDLVTVLTTEDIFADRESMRAHLSGRDVTPLLLGTYAALSEAQELLRGHQVPSMLASEVGDELDAAIHQRLYLVVAADEAARAREVLGKVWEESLVREGLGQTAAAEVVGACPACGTAMNEDATECPDCGLVLG